MMWSKGSFGFQLARTARLNWRTEGHDEHEDGIRRLVQSLMLLGIHEAQLLASMRLDGKDITRP
jgi:hypothetical protein